MEALHSSFIHPIPLPSTTPYSSSKSPNPPKKYNSKPKPPNAVVSCSVVRRDPWSLTDGDPDRPKPKSKNPKNSLSDDNARRIIKAKAVYLSTLRRNQGSLAQTPKWIKRTPQQMAQYLEDDRHGHLYGRHVVAAIRLVRSLSQKPEGSYDMRQVMSTFVTKLTFREMCTVLKEQRGWKQARDFFAWMKLQLGYRPTVIAYTIVLRMYGQIGKIKLAEETFLEMLEAGCEADEVACGTMLCAYARWGRHIAMLSFYSAVQERGIIPSVAVYNFMLSSLQKKSLHQNVIDLWRQMVSSRVMPNSFTYTVVISSFVQLGLAEDAFQTLKEMKDVGFVPEEVTYSLLIILSSKMGNRDFAFSLYQDMRSYNIVPSNFTCASLLTLHYKNGDYTKAVSLFSEMERYKIVADEVIYSLIVRIYGRLGLYEDAEKTFNEIQKLGLLSDEKTYTTMAQIHLNAANVEKALGVMEQMRSKNIQFSRFAFTVLLRCYIVKEDLASAEDTFMELSKTGLPDSGSCNDMLGLYMKLGLGEKAKGFLIQIRKDGVKFDDELLKKVMKVYCKEGMLREAEQLMEELSTSAKPSLYKLMFDEYAKCSKPEEAYIFYREETEKGNNVMGAVAISILVNNLTNCGKYREAENVIHDCFRDKLELDTVAYNTFIKAMLKAGRLDFAASIYERMLSSGVVPSIRTVNTMISVYGRGRNLSKAVEMFNVVQTMGVALDEKAYTNMLCYYANAGESHDATLLFSKMREEGIKPGLASYNIMMNVYGVRGMYREAEELIQDMGRDGCSPDSFTYLSLVRAYTVGLKYSEAEETIDSMQKKGGILKASCDHYNLLVSALGKAGLVGEAKRVYRKVIGGGLNPDVGCNRSMMRVYVENGHVQQGISFFESITSNDRFIMSWAVHLYRSAGMEARAEVVLNSMETLGIPFLKSLRIGNGKGKGKKAV